MTRPFLLSLALIALPSCATINGVPQTPCQRATRAIDAAHDAVRLAVDAGADPVIIAKLNKAIDDAQIVAGVACAGAGPVAS